MLGSPYYVRLRGDDALRVVYANSIAEAAEKFIRSEDEESNNRFAIGSKSLCCYVNEVQYVVKCSIKYEAKLI